MIAVLAGLVPALKAYRTPVATNLVGVLWARKVAGKPLTTSAIIGMGAIMLGYAGYLYSLNYARERPQGRLPDGKDPASTPVPIIQHTDVKRMLLMQIQTGLRNRYDWLAGWKLVHD